MIPHSELTFEAIAFSVGRSRALSMTQKVSAALETLPAAGAVPLESILCTEELRRRPSHSAEFEKENSALVSLVSALADSPRTILQTLADKVLEVLRADSAGLSLLTKDETRFYWAAISGAWGRHVGGGTPRTFGPCGDVLDHNAPMLFSHWELRYPYLSSAMPLAEEGLLVPFYVNGKAVGTIWAIAHDKRRQFDAEDLRLLESMGRFASAAYQAVESIESLNWEIAAREKAEAEVRELASGLEAKIRRLVEANVVGIVMWNLEGAITGANDAFLRTVQYDREDVAFGRVRWMDLTPAEWRSYDERAIADLKTTGIFQPFQKEYIRKDGSRVPVLLGGALFEGSGNEGVAFVIDLSEQKRTERALRRSEAFLAEGQRLSSTGTFSWRVPTDEITWSNQLYRIYELEIGTPVTMELIRTRVHPEDRTLYEKMVKEARAAANDFEWHYRLMMPDQSIKYLYAVAHATRDENGQLEYIAAIQDVTARRLSEEALGKIRSDLAHATRVMTMGEMVSSISHEINQPLGSIANYGNAARRFLTAEPKQLQEVEQALAKMVTEADRASAVIGRIRALSRKSQPEKVALHIEELIDEVLALAHRELVSRQVAVHTEFAEELPLVRGDRVELQQVLLNLVTNGADAMSSSSGSRALLVRAERSEQEPDSFVRVCVRDSGIGIRAEELDRIFTAFYTTKHQGMGLGLAVSRTIVESHGGRLWAEANNDGPGATFHFTVPAAG